MPGLACASAQSDSLHSMPAYGITGHLNNMNREGPDQSTWI